MRAHTFSSAKLTRVALNGVEMTEGSWNAAIAGHFNVPVIMMSGDDAAIAEVRKVVGNIEGAETKKSLGFHSALTITPQASVELIGQRVKAAICAAVGVQAVPRRRPGDGGGELQALPPGRGAGLSPDVRAHGSHSIRFRAKDMVEASSVMEFIGEYQADLTP